MCLNHTPEVTQEKPCFSGIHVLLGLSAVGVKKKKKSLHSTLSTRAFCEVDLYPGLSDRVATGPLVPNGHPVR